MHSARRCRMGIRMSWNLEWNVLVIVAFCFPFGRAKKGLVGEIEAYFFFFEERSLQKNAICPVCQCLEGGFSWVPCRIIRDQLPQEHHLSIAIRQSHGSLCVLKWSTTILQTIYWRSKGPIFLTFYHLLFSKSHFIMCNSQDSSKASNYLRGCRLVRFGEEILLLSTSERQSRMVGSHE